MRGRNARGQGWAVGVLLASMTSAAPGLTQGNSAPAAAAPQVVNGSRAAAVEGTEKESVRLYDDGVKSAKAGQWEKARVAMLAAFKLSPSSAWAANLGRVEMMANRPRDAAEHLSYFLRETQGIEADDRSAAEAMLAEAKAKIAVLVIQVQPIGAEVLVDDISVGHTPLTDALFVDPGPHKVAARFAGRPDETRLVTLKAGSSESVALELASPTATSPTVNPAPAPAPRSEPVPVPPSPEPAKSRALVFGGAGLALGALGAGIAFTVISNAKASDADAMHLALHQPSAPTAAPGMACTNQQDSIACAALASTNRSSAAFRNLAIAGYGTAGLVGAATLVYALWPSKKAGARTGLTVIPTGRGILVDGHF